MILQCGPPLPGLVEVIEIFYASDEDETGGLDKKELERALARVYDVTTLLSWAQQRKIVDFSLLSLSNSLSIVYSSTGV